MRSTRTVFVSFAAAVCSLTAAHAESFSFSFGSPTTTFSASGTLTGDPINANGVRITEITGNTTYAGNTLGIASLAPVGGVFFNDNAVEVFPGGLSFDSGGLSYFLSDGTQIELFGSGGEYLQQPGGPLVSEEVPISLAVTTAVAPTPEPGSFVLLGTGVLAALGVARRRFLA